MSILALVGGIIDAVTSLGAKYIEDQVKRKQFETEVREILYKAITDLVNAVIKEEQLKAKVIIAETASDSWLTRNWRPIVILIFTALVVMYWFGFTPPNLDKSTLHDLFLIIQGAIWGYIGSRGLEKTAGKLAQVLFFKNK